MFSNVGDLLLALWKHIRAVLDLQYQAFVTYSTVGLQMLEDADALEEAGAFFCELSEEKLEGYCRLVELNRKNYHCCFLTCAKPPFELPSWEAPLGAMEFALELEKRLESSIKNLYSKAYNYGYSELCNLLRGHFLMREQKVLEEMQAHLGTVCSLEAQQEQSHRLQCWTLHRLPHDPLHCCDAVIDTHNHCFA